MTHRVDDEIAKPFPCFYGGGGSSAYDRHKFLELGGFDEILKPFYYEDTDLGFMAWKRGWKVLYQPRSVVFHEHRGTIGRKFSPQYIQGVLKKNAVLMVWKNIHSRRMLLTHFTACFTSSFHALISGDQPGSFSFPGIAKAFLQIGSAAAARWRARSLAAVDDREAFRRHVGGYFRDVSMPRSNLFLRSYGSCSPPLSHRTSTPRRSRVHEADARITRSYCAFARDRHG